MQSLFPQHNSHSATEKPLLEFKAGKCAMVAQEGGDFMVSPEDRRGKIAIVKGEGYVYFRWIDRSSNQMDENCNWIVFQNSVVFKKIDTGRSEDRVYLLKWKDENRRLMFWMQDKSSDKDEENCKQVNELFNNPAAVTAAVAAASQQSAGAGAGAGGNGAEEWMRMLGLAPPAPSTSAGASTSTPPPAASTIAAPGAGNAQALDLARILAGLGANSSNIAPPTSTAAAPRAPTTNSSASTLSASDLARAFASTSTASDSSSHANSSTSNSTNQDSDSSSSTPQAEEKKEDEKTEDFSADDSKMDES